MRIEFLGTASALPIPRPTCDCRVCSEARGRGVPYSRGGPSVFVHGPDLLIDTPEDIDPALNRAGIRHIGAITWSHWHPDHTAGSRVVESLNMDLSWPPQYVCTPVYVPQAVRADFDRFHGLAERLAYHEKLGIIREHIIPEGGSVTLDGVTLEPLRLPDPAINACGFILTEGSTRVLIVPDEILGWEPPADLGHFNLAVLPAGIFELHPLTGERLIPAEHPILEHEATFTQVLDMVRALHADRVILTHLLAHDTSYDDLMQAQRRLGQEAPELRHVMFAFDRLSVMP